MTVISQWFLVCVVGCCDTIAINKEAYMKKFFKFVLAMIISFLPGIFGVLFTPSHSNDVWYNALQDILW